MAVVVLQRMRLFAAAASLYMYLCTCTAVERFEFPPDPTAPTRLLAYRDVQPLLAGFVDPTLAPYGAKGDGVADDAAALQAAIDDAYVARMTVILPAGKVFLLSKQLRFIQPLNITGRSYGFAMVRQVTAHRTHCFEIGCGTERRIIGAGGRWQRWGHSTAIVAADGRRKH